MYSIPDSTRTSFYIFFLPSFLPPSSLHPPTLPSMSLSHLPSELLVHVIEMVDVEAETTHRRRAAFASAARPLHSSLVFLPLPSFFCTRARAARSLGLACVTLHAAVAQWERGLREMSFVLPLECEAHFSDASLVFAATLARFPRKGRIKGR